LGANIIQLDLSDGPAVATVIDKNQSMCDEPLLTKWNADPSAVDIIIHTASSIDRVFISNLLQALGRRRIIAKTPVYFVHVR
jgi:hypothetical protein